MNYQDFYQASIQDPASFWDKQAQLISWHKPVLPEASIKRI
jgi:hypothetical protein